MIGKYFFLFGQGEKNSSRSDKPKAESTSSTNYRVVKEVECVCILLSFDKQIAIKPNSVFEC